MILLSGWWKKILLKINHHEQADSRVVVADLVPDYVEDFTHPWNATSVKITHFSQRQLVSEEENSSLLTPKKVEHEAKERRVCVQIAGDLEARR